jgi:hypothetical protein
MNINEILEKLSVCSDNELLLITKSGIARFAALLAKAEHTELLQRRKRNQRCASVTLFAKSSGKSIFDSNNSEKLTSYPYDQNLFETQNLIESVYKKIISKYKETSWVRGDLKPEIHVAALKQFWLDCYVADANFLALLLAALQGKVWVGLSGFKKALDSTRGVSAFAIFSIKRYDKKLQQHFLIQKMICK